MACTGLNPTDARSIFSVNCPPTDWNELVQMHDERDAIQASPDELPVIDIRSLTSVLPQRVVKKTCEGSRSSVAFSRNVETDASIPDPELREQPENLHGEPDEGDHQGERTPRPD